MEVLSSQPSPGAPQDAEAGNGAELSLFPPAALAPVAALVPAVVRLHSPAPAGAGRKRWQQTDRQTDRLTASGRAV